MANVRKRFKNVSESLQVLYDERGEKREVVPGGTIILGSDWGSKYRRFLVAVEPKKVVKEEKSEK